MPIKDLPLHLRPQEKALMRGIDSLSELELLALVIRSGSARSDALQLASDLLQRFGSIKSILEAPIESILKVRGIGKVKALQLKAIYRLLFSFASKESMYIHDDFQLALLAHSLISDFSRENFIVVLLNRNNEVIFFENMYKGTRSGVSISPNEIVSLAVTKSAAKFLCVHNHPSGDVKPSKNDILLTKRLAYISEMFGFNFNTHIIINSNKDYQLISW